ncbi:ethanolamine ammonia-lyase subunit EutC [Rhodoplanes sp. TEM]|uniref:Ethanolamine ammonia-lyase small subunit n=1 Tax=Rhodoplanes tepidamans TaxID=200616 RepID=A0ABT5JF94_RHOTP|nr:MULTISPECIES: ethanolamine ammonia-lyase subunit EutC [Rhodoplanes]MDC7788249.1 ethanolamine ammonia-lyase subunit EutC [Rhodoplanes tepidamans]MDC7982946.1 ethanolamine ammonia-lyase subunit EutC [Rhodoplanes sp. TEM]MDQ0355883.1 ethanolamine ammonia-lyase small subunit [Rhodoplanes tepidamans]
MTRRDIDDRDSEAWAALRSLTAARIGLKRAGASLATAPLLDFRLAHARARDAVQAPFEQARLHRRLAEAGPSVLSVASAAADRRAYLMRPDLGRRLSADAEAILAPRAAAWDLVLVVTDGLSAQAVERHAAPVLAGLLPTLTAEGWRVAPLVVVRHGRVAVGDAVATALGADSVVVLIGERPGLSSPDSMGAYLTWRPQPATTDADRNCLSNIRADGVLPAAAAVTLMHLLRAMRARRLSGVRLKDESDAVRDDRAGEAKIR